MRSTIFRWSRDSLCGVHKMKQLKLVSLAILSIDGKMQVMEIIFYIELAERAQRAEPQSGHKNEVCNRYMVRREGQEFNSCVGIFPALSLSLFLPRFLFLSPPFLLLSFSFMLTPPVQYSSIFTSLRLACTN